MKTVTNHINILKDKLSERMSANPRYSMRAFARDLDILPQTLSRILNGDKGLSLRTAQSIAQKLNFSATETDFFCTLVESQFSRSLSARKIANAKLAHTRSLSLTSQNLSTDSFRVISDWYHFGIIELLKLSSSEKKNPKWIAKRLGIQEIEVVLALERLERLELVSKTRSGYSLNQDSLFTTDGVPSDALRKFHKQVLERAIQAITLQSVEHRDITASFMPIDVKDLSAAKKSIKEFRETFVKNFSKESGNEVYSLSMQFFSLTMKE